MAYFRVQPYPAQELLDGPRSTTYWSDDADDVVTVPGVAVCRDLQGLSRYLLSSGAPWGEDWKMVELEGDEIAYVSEDACLGVVYIHPRRIIAVEPAEARLVPLVTEQENETVADRADRPVQ